MTTDTHPGTVAAMTERITSADTRRNLRSDPDFWQAFHDARPRSPFPRPVEDPTRAGGWCCLEMV